MCLLEILLALTAALTWISGGYHDHARLFWSVIATTLGCAYTYGWSRKPPPTASPGVRAAFEMATGWLGFACAALFIWLMVAIWL